MPAPVLNHLPQEKLTISEKRRELMHRAMDGHADLAGVMQILNNYRFCDNFLIWLIEHRYTGKNLRELVIVKFKSSVPTLVEWMVGAMNRSDITEIRASGKPVHA